MLISFFRFGYYFIEPVIAGLDPSTNEPYIATMDLIGCPMETKDFVVAGTCSQQLYGMCESLWKPDLVNERFLSPTNYLMLYIYRSQMIYLRLFLKH